MNKKEVILMILLIVVSVVSVKCYDKLESDFALKSEQFKQQQASWVNTIKHLSQKQVEIDTLYLRAKKEVDTTYIAVKQYLMTDAPVPAQLVRTILRVDSTALKLCEAARALCERRYNALLQLSNSYQEEATVWKARAQPSLIQQVKMCSVPTAIGFLIGSIR